MTPLHPIADKREARAKAAFDIHVRDTVGWTNFSKSHTQISGAEYQRAFEAGFATAEQQRISEGEVLEEAGKHWFVFKRAFLDRYAGWPSEGIEAMQALNRLLPNSCALISSPVAPDGEGGQKSALLTLLAQDGYESLTAFTDDLLAEEDEARLDTLIGEAVTYLHHLAATHTGITPEEIG